MEKWPRLSRARTRLCQHLIRAPLSTLARVEHVEVPCASSGSITVSLHNVLERSPTAPLLIYLPPFSRSAAESLVSLPPCLLPYPIAIINYRWPDQPARELSKPPSSGGQPKPPLSSQPLHWPTPIHDTLFGYSWLTENLLPPDDSSRRDVYVYGSFLGAGLAAALALTECHPHQRMAVRGFSALNGVYNWTAFLPDHPDNRAAREKLAKRQRRGGRRSKAAMAAPSPDLSSSPAQDDEEVQRQQEDPSMIRYMRAQMPTLFGSATNLFDPFASPSLLFHSPGMQMPPSFTESTLPDSFAALSALSPSLLGAIDALSGDPLYPDPPAQLVATPKVPRKGYLAFPPRQSTLKIPEALLLHVEAAAPYPDPSLSPPGQFMHTPTAFAGALANSYRSQARELTGLMQRSIDLLELKARRRWDDDFDGWDDEAQRRVRIEDVGAAPSDSAAGRCNSLGARGEEILRNWLEDRMQM